MTSFDGVDALAIVDRPRHTQDAACLAIVLAAAAVFVRAVMLLAHQIEIVAR